MKIMDSTTRCFSVETTDRSVKETGFPSSVKPSILSTDAISYISPDFLMTYKMDVEKTDLYPKYRGIYLMLGTTKISVPRTGLLGLVSTSDMIPTNLLFVIGHTKNNGEASLSGFIVSGVNIDDAVDLFRAFRAQIQCVMGNMNHPKVINQVPTCDFPNIAESLGIDLTFIPRFIIGEADKN